MEPVIDMIQPSAPPQSALFRFTVNILGNVSNEPEIERFLNAHVASAALERVLKNRSN